MRTMSFLFLVVFIAMISCSQPPKPEVISKYPVSAKVDTVDTYFGVEVPDPYRWMENDTAEQTANWVDKQIDLTTNYLNSIPYRKSIRQRLEEVYDYERLGTPFRYGDYFYYSRNNGLQNQSVYYRKKGANGEPEVFLDPNTFSTDGTTRLGGMSFSKDGSHVAYQVAKSGSDWTEAVIIDAITKVMLEDTLRDLKFASISWRGNEGFFYTRYPVLKGTSRNTAKAENQKLYYHKLGTPYAKDQLIFGDDANPKRYVWSYLTEDEQFHVILATDGTSGQEMYVRDLSLTEPKLNTLVGNQENDHRVIDNTGKTLLVQTNYKAPNQRLVKVEIATPTVENWKDVVKEEKSVANFSTGGGKIFADYTVDVKSLIKQFSIEGTFEHDVELPGIGSAGWDGARTQEKELYYSFTSFLYPTTIFKYDIQSGKSSVFTSPKVNLEASQYEMKQVFYESKDGTRVPMFIVHKKGLEMNGKNATLLYGYGGFNISLTPYFDPSLIVWLENGGIYAQPNLRGGGEYGEEWHKAGTKLQKQNVFDDFIAAAEYLITEKFTSKDFLAIQGGSNGGLLVGACMTQRPDLFKVTLPGVGVMDMLRYHKFSAGPGWAPDYGTVEDSKEMFEYLRGYSPVHNLKPGTSYPATLVSTADHDDRVVPAHSFKFAAGLQETHTGNNPVLIRIDRKSAHGSSNLSKGLDLDADQFAFTWYNMGIVPPLAKKNL
ncbi:MAG: prolyl oligopeptidase family serine peptidase [Cyclobacteriaceae bacterium]